MIASAIALAACTTEPPPPPVQAQGSALKAVRRDDSFVVVRFMDETALKARYSYKFNPFISIPHVFQPIRFYVFKINVEEVKRPIVLKLNQMTFQMGGILGGPLDRQQLARYWDGEDQESGITSLERTDRDRWVREEPMPNQVVIPAGGRSSGLVVFWGNYPERGEGHMSLPLYDEQKTQYDQIELTFKF